MMGTRALVAHLYKKILQQIVHILSIVQKRMEKKMKGWSVLAFGLVILVFNASPSEPTITCNEAITSLIPCQPFLVGFGPATPSVFCCMDAEDLFELANTTKTRRALCECFKQAATEIGVLPERAQLLPQFCKIHVSVPVDAHVNCSK